jgi:hypothetical protein
MPNASPWRVAVAAVCGFLWCATLTPLMAAVWLHGGGEAWDSGTLIERTFGPVLEARGLLTFGEGDLPYEVFGKGFFLVYLLMLPAVLAVPGRLGHRGGLDVVRVSAWAICGAVVAALMGDFASYWGVSLTGRLGELLWGGGFLLEMLALVVLMVGMVVYGVAAARAGRVSRAVGALLSGAVIAVVPTVVFVTDYVPNGIVLPLSLAWAICAVIMLAPGQSSSGVSKGKRPVSGEANGRKRYGLPCDSNHCVPLPSGVATGSTTM